MGKLGKAVLKCGPMMLIMSAGILAFNTICGGRYSFIAIDVVVALISGFYISGKISGKKNNYNKLEEAFDYMEQLSFAFIRNGQVAEALNETAALFTEGKMHDTLNEAITLLDEEYDMTGRRKALEHIEVEYPTSLIVKLHDYMVRAETYGGDVKRAISVLKNEQYEKKLSMKEYGKQLGIRRKNCILSCIAGGLISGVMILFAPDKDALIGNIVYQISLMLFSCLSCFIIAFTYKKTVVDFLKDKRIYSDEELRDKLKRYISGSGFLNKIMLKKVLGREMRFAFNEWILSVTLLLESHNVEGAIEASLDTAPYCMKPYLMEFVDKVHDNPGNITPYIEFLEDFSFPEVKSSMRLLYSLSVGTLDSIGEAVTHLIEQNGNSLKGLEDEKRDANLAGLSMIFMLPVALTSFKLIADMSLILLYFISRL